MQGPISGSALLHWKVRNVRPPPRAAVAPRRTPLTSDSDIPTRRVHKRRQIGPGPGAIIITNPALITTRRRVPTTKRAET